MTTKKPAPATTPTTPPCETLPAAQPLNPLALFGGQEGALSGVELRLPQIGIIHQPKGMFTMPDGTSPTEIAGVILHVTNVNAFWRIPFDQSGGGSPPDCYSLDGKKPDYNCMDVQAEFCLKCPQNIFDKQTGLKPCKNKKRIHILFDGATMPYRLTSPVTSCENWNVYASMLISQNFPYQAVITAISLIDAASKEGIKYKKLSFRKQEAIPLDDLPAIRELWLKWKPIMEGQAFDNSEA